MVLLINTTAKIDNKLQKTIYEAITNDFQQNVKSAIDNANILPNPFPECVTFEAHTLLNFIVSAMGDYTNENRRVNAFNIKFTKLSGAIINDPRFNPINANQISVVIYLLS